MNASGGVPGWCNESRVTCMKNYAWWLCHKYDVNYMIMQSNMTMMERVIVNGMAESCMAILSGLGFRQTLKVRTLGCAQSLSLQPIYTLAY